MLRLNLRRARGTRLQRLAGVNISIETYSSLARGSDLCIASRRPMACGRKGKTMVAVYVIAAIPAVALIPLVPSVRVITPGAAANREPVRS